jgi:hypothetical protein
VKEKTIFERNRSANSFLPQYPPFYKREARGDFDDDQLQRQIEKTDREIDSMIYRLDSMTIQHSKLSLVRGQS